MGSTYTRQSSYTDGDVIQATDTNNEFDQLVAVFNESTGHTHDGTSQEGGPITKLLGNTLTFGAGTSGTDVTVTFDGETNDGVLKWMEDEDYFEFSDDILVASTEKLQFRDTAIYINSSTDGQLDIVADTLVQVATAAFTVDASGDITLDAGGADVVLKDDGTTFGSLTNSSGELVIKSGSTPTAALTFSGANITAEGNLTVDGNLDVTGTLDLSDSAFTNVGDVQLDSISGDADTNTSITFSGSDVITVATGGTTSFTVDASQNILMNAAQKIQFRDTALTINSSTDGQLDIDADTEVEITAPTVHIAASTAITMGSDAVTFGEAGDTDIVLSFNANSNDGEIKWMEDEDYFEFSDDILVASTEKIQFRDTALTINSSTDGQLDIDADTELEITAPTVDINASTAVLVSNDLKLDSDSAVLGFGADNDTTLTHTDGTGLTLNSTNKLTFGDAASFVQQSSDGVLRIDGEATVDINASTAVLVSNDLKLDSDAAVLGFGVDNDVTLTHVADTGLLLNSTMALQFNDASQFINAPSATVLDINATDEIELNATAIDINGTLDVSGSAVFNTSVEVVTSDNSTQLTLKSTDADASVGPVMVFERESASAAGDDEIGRILFVGRNSENNADVNYGSIETHISAAAAASAGGYMKFRVASHDGETQSGLEIRDGNAEDEVDVTIGNGTNSITSVVGNFQIKDGGTIGSASDTDAITIASDGQVTFSQAISGTSADFDGGVTIDNITIDGTEIDLSSGTLTIDAASITLDASDSISTTTLGTSNVKLGANAGNSILSGGNYNVLIGDEAGTAITTGDTNVLVGYTAGDAITTGYDNVAIGTSALSTDILSNSSVAIGKGALQNQNPATAVTTHNVAVGTDAGNDITTGTANTLIGGLAGDALTTGYDNVAVGYNALTNEDVGGRSVALGREALRDQNTVTLANIYNLGVGYQAGASVTTGESNNIIGGLAGDALTTGSFNQVLGVAALGADTLGSRSVAIGHGALLTQNFTTATDNYNIAIGHNAGLAVTTGLYNTLIGGLAGDAITDADQNVAVGVSSLSSDTLGSRSTALGNNALAAQNFTTATNTYNVAAGYNAGAAVTTGTLNNIVGGLAGDALTTGSENVVMGHAALSTEDTGRKNVAIGYSALNAQNADVDNYNTAVGYNAGLSVTTGVQNTLVGGLSGDALTEGNYNTALGYAALSADDLGSQSVAIGYHALVAQNYATATTSYNVAVGASAGANISTGTSNTAVGAAALDADTKGSHNTAVGFGSLSTQNFTTSTDAYNVAVGSFAGEANATGVSNTFIGGLAGRNVTGGSNTAVGAAAMDAAVSGSQNTAIGVNCLGAANGAANNNTAVGVQAGASVTTGDNNLLLGLDAGQTGSPGGAITTSNNNIVLGDENIGSGQAHIQVSLTVASDQRDKTDFTALDLGLNFVKALAPVTYKWDKRSKYGDKKADDYDLNAQTPDGTHKEDWLDVGFKAQEVEALEIAAGYKIADKTNLVTSLSSDGKQYGMQYEKFVPILVKALQELSTKNDALEARIATLEG